MLFEFEFEVLGRLLCLCTSSHAWACKPPRSLPNDRIILPNPPIFRSRVMCVRTLRTTSETGTVQQPGWGIAVCGLCSVVALCWWAGVCCVCLWWFPALVLLAYAFLTIASLCNTSTKALFVPFERMWMILGSSPVLSSGALALIYAATKRRNRGNRNSANNSRKPQTSHSKICLLYTSPSPRDRTRSRMPSSA